MPASAPFALSIASSNPRASIDAEAKAFGVLPVVQPAGEETLEVQRDHRAVRTERWDRVRRDAHGSGAFCPMSVTSLPRPCRRNAG